MSDTQAYVSLAINDTSANAAHVLGDSLRDTHTNRHLALLVTDNVSQHMRCRLRKTWDNIIDIETLGDETLSSCLEQPNLEKIFMKLKLWKLTQFTKCVFLDADTLVLQNVDELFEREELSAAPDVGWPDCFNSGVFVYVPSNETYASLIKHTEEHGSFDDSDQGVLNTFFKDWSTTTASHLPYIYNMVSNACYTYAPAVNYFGKNIKIVHFVESQKPWTQYFDYGQSRVIGQPSQHPGNSSSAYHDAWWDRYRTLQDSAPFHHDNVDKDAEVNHIESTGGDHREGVCGVSDQQKAWERGDIDFMHKDRFTVIRHYLDNSMGEMKNEPYEEVQYDCYFEQVDEDYRNSIQCETIDYKSEQEGQQGDGETNGEELVYHLQYNDRSNFIETQSQNEVEGPSRKMNEDTNVNETVSEEVSSFEQGELDPETAARLRWEVGNIDFTGEDSFSKIEMYLNSLLEQLELSANLEECPAKECKELDFPSEGHLSDPHAVNGVDDVRTSRDTSPSLFSVTDSAYSDGTPRKPVMMSRGTQTSFLCLSRAVQTDFDILDVQ